MNIFNRLRETVARGLAALRGTGIVQQVEEVGSLAATPQDSTDELPELPPEQLQRIRDRLHALPLPSALLESEIAALDDAIALWLEKPDSQCNAIAILGNAVEEIARIVGTGLQKREGEGIPVRILQWSERPSDLHVLESRLVTQLGRGLPLSKELAPEIVLIPDLSWCFLRSADGLGGIEYLRRAIASERDRFWIIGCGKLAWNYLNLIAKIAAYVPDPYLVPTFDGEKLQTWLTPIVEEFDIHFDEYRHLPLADLEQPEDRQQEYFKDLAELCEGSISIARELFARSLRVNEQESESSFIFANEPKLPDLPALSSDAQYLIYALLLHDRIKLTHLAESLGDSEMNVQSLLQSLKASAIVIQSGNLFQVNPLHYPRLRSLLDSNNFLMPEE